MYFLLFKPGNIYDNACLEIASRSGLENCYNPSGYTCNLQRRYGMQGILIYSTKNCPNCRVLKQFLENKNVRFTEVDMATPAALTELRMNGVFTMAAPVLQIGNKFHTYNDLFTQDRINQDKLESLLNEGK